MLWKHGAIVIFRGTSPSLDGVRGARRVFDRFRIELRAPMARALDGQGDDLRGMGGKPQRCPRRPTALAPGPGLPMTASGHGKTRQRGKPGEASSFQGRGGGKVREWRPQTRTSSMRIGLSMP